MELQDEGRLQITDGLCSLQHAIAELRASLTQRSPAATAGPTPPDFQARGGQGGADISLTSRPAASEAEEGSSSDGQMFHQVVHRSPVGILAFERDGILTVWNAEMERISGISSADAVGRNALEVLAGLGGDGGQGELAQALGGEEVRFSDRFLHVAARGRTAVVEGWCLPLRGVSGSPDGVVCYIRDVTGQKEMIEAQLAAENRYRELFENASDMVYAIDLQGNFTSVNKAAERITGFSPAEMLHMKLLDLVAPDHRDLARTIFQRQLAGEPPATHELDILTKGGSRIALEISVHLLSRSNQAIGLQGIARDVTERKRTDEALQQAKLNLEAWVLELEQRTREMTLLSEMGDLLRACLTTDEAYSVIVRVAQQIFPVQVGALYVISSSRNLLEAVALWGETSIAERVFSPDECWALRRGRVHWVEDPATGLLCKHLHHPPPEGYLCVPMMAQSEAIGVLHLSQPSHTRLTEAKQRLAVTMAEHIAMALSNLKLHETLRSQSIRDPLTGLFNRRFMEESLELELRRAVRNQRPLSVIMLDLDRFKHYNDTYGHDAGDGLLRELGKLLQTNIRAEDIACRFGGEEFTLIMPEGNAEIAQQRAEVLREAIKHMEVVHRGMPLGSITASLGVAVFPENGRTRDALLQAADSALYRSKQEGGDKVTADR